MKLGEDLESTLLVQFDFNGIGGGTDSVIVLDGFGNKRIDEEGEFLFCWRHFGGFRCW